MMSDWRHDEYEQPKGRINGDQVIHLIAYQDPERNWGAALCKQFAGDVEIMGMALLTCKGCANAAGSRKRGAGTFMWHVMRGLDTGKPLLLTSVGREHALTIEDSRNGKERFRAIADMLEAEAKDVALLSGHVKDGEASVGDRWFDTKTRKEYTCVGNNSAGKPMWQESSFWTEDPQKAHRFADHAEAERAARPFAAMVVSLEDVVELMP